MKIRHFLSKRKGQELFSIATAAVIMSLVPATFFAYSIGNVNDVNNTESVGESGEHIRYGWSPYRTHSYTDEELEQRQKDYMNQIIESSVEESGKAFSNVISGASSTAEEFFSETNVVSTENSNQTPLVETWNTDESYTGQSYYLDYYSRMYIEAIVMREAGYQGYEGCALVAQCMRDALVYKGYGNVYDMVEDMGYSGSTELIPNDDVKNAVKFIFDDGGIAVKHRIYFYYAWTWGDSEWHETQEPVVTYKDHKFFDTWE